MDCGKRRSLPSVTSALPACLGRQGTRIRIESLFRLDESEQLPMAILQLLKGDGPAEELQILGDRAVLGRHPDCDIVLDAASVSRQHAQILKQDKQYFVEDLHSRNGTFVNGRLIQGRHLLQDGDRLKICDLALTFYTNQPSDRLLEVTRIDSGSSIALMVDDAEPTATSTIVSKLDVASSHGSVRLTVNAEVKLRAMIEIAHNLGKAVSLDDGFEQTAGQLVQNLHSGRSRIRDPPPSRRHPGAQGDQAPPAGHGRPDPHQPHDRQPGHEEPGRRALGRRHQRFAIRHQPEHRRSAHPFDDVRAVGRQRGQFAGRDSGRHGDQRHRFQRKISTCWPASLRKPRSRSTTRNCTRPRSSNKSLERDLELAHKVQRGLLPVGAAADWPATTSSISTSRPTRSAAITTTTSSCRATAWPWSWATCRARASAAALIMAKLSGEVRFCLASEPDPAAAMNRINSSFSRSGWQDRFVTFVLAVLDADPPRNHGRQRRTHAAAVAAQPGQGGAGRQRRGRAAVGHRRRLSSISSTRASSCPAII